MSDASKTILLAGGGTGGHLYPGIAVAEALRALSSDYRCIFLCTTREIDRVILEPTGFEFIPQPIVPPQRSIGGLLKFWTSWRSTKDLVRKIIREKTPAVVLGLGGYAAGVAVKVAAHKNIPTAVLNPDVIPGKANQYLMRYARAVCCQFDETKQRVATAHQDKLVTTGCPIRRDLLDLPPRDVAIKRLGLNSNLRTLVITGASQGAMSVNDAIVELAPSLNLQGWQILHLSGRDHAEKVRNGYREKKLSATVVDFTAAMADVWAVADLAISRAGASSCAELTACGIPSILMPYPYHKDLHQRANALALQAAGAALLVDDEKDAKRNADKLKPMLDALLTDSDRRKLMSESARKMALPDAASAVASVITKLASASR